MRKGEVMSARYVSISTFFTTFTLAAVIALAGCGGGGGGGGGGEATTLTVRGTVSIPEGQPTALTAALLGSKWPRYEPLFPVSAYYTTVILNGANVTLCRPTENGIELVSEAPVATSSSTGQYSVEVDMRTAVVESGQPLLVCASNANGTFTLLSMIPSNRVRQGEVVELDVTPVTTAVATILCPGGKYPPPTGAACYTVAEEDLDTLTNSVAAYLNQHPELYTDLTLLDQWLVTVLGDPAVSSDVDQVSGEYGYSAPTTSDIQNSPAPPIVITEEAQNVGEGEAEVIPGDTETPEEEPATEPETSAIAGSWTGSYTVTYPASCYGFSGSWSATLAESGGVISGNYTSDMGVNGSVSGAWDGTTATWTVGGGGGASFSGSITGNRISGSWSGPDYFGVCGDHIKGTFEGNKT